MFVVRALDSLNDPELGPYLTLRQQADHYRERLFVAEGSKVVWRLLESGLEVVSMLLPPDQVEEYAPALASRPETVQVFTAEKPLVEHLTGFSLYQGILACARVPAPFELDVLCGLSSRPRFFVALDGLANAENLGAIVRNAAAFGAQGLLVGETCASPYLRRSVRSSMGNVFHLPVVEPHSLPEALRYLRRRGFRCVGAHPHTEQCLLPSAGLRGDSCVVVGSEGQGLSEEVRECCDELVAIPMASGVDSLNVAAAAAVFFYELWRQRRASGS